MGQGQSRDDLDMVPAGFQKGRDVQGQSRDSPRAVHGHFGNGPQMVNIWSKTVQRWSKDGPKSVKRRSKDGPKTV